MSNEPVASRKYDGKPIDATYQHLTERPYGGDDGETVYATEEPSGKERTVGEIVFEDDVKQKPHKTEHTRPDTTGQTSCEDWR